MIEFNNVSKIYEDLIALEDISFEIDEGAFVFLVGPSGSGKSTAVNMIGCLDIPTTGSIYLDGQDISKVSESALAQIRGRRIGNDTED